MARNNKGKTIREVEQSKNEKLMRTIAVRAAYYRANPHRFVSEYLGITYLKWFQKILLYAAMKYDAFYFIACRGLGKTYLVSLFCVCRCILYPGTKIVVSSATFKQGKETVNKIVDDFMHNSAMLRNEVLKFSVGQNDCGVWFKNGSYIIVKVASETSRGARANVLIIDESRMVKRNIIDTVLIPMLNAPRSPGYLSKPEYSHMQEIGRILQMTSAWYKQSEMYEEVKTYTGNMLNDDSNFFICDLPYQISVQSGLIMRETIEREMSKQTFNDISFMMEYEGKFYGATQDALYDYKVISKQRQLDDALYDLELYKDGYLSIPKKQLNETRILSLDIALLASKKHKNDASCFTLNQCIYTNDNFISNYSYVDTAEGLTTEELGLLTMRLFYQFDCDYLAIDANGVGQGVLDYIMSSRYDNVYLQEYKAMSTINNPELNIRCKEKNPNVCVYAIKASAKLNNDMILSLRSGLQNGSIMLLKSDTDIEDGLQDKIKNYNKLSELQQIKLKVPYAQTTALVEEIINLEHDLSNNLIKVKEKTGMRKDRFSSILYNNYVVDQLRLKKKVNTNTKEEIRRMFKVHSAKNVCKYR